MTAAFIVGAVVAVTAGIAIAAWAVGRVLRDFWDTF